MKNTSTLSKVIKRISKYSFILALSLLLALVSVALTLYLPILLGNAIDLITDTGVDLVGILPILTKAAVIIAFTALAQWLMNYFNNKITYNVIRDIRRDAFGNIQSLPLSYLDRHPTGDIVSRVISDADTFAQGLLLGFSQFFTGIMTILGTIAFMLALDYRIALVVILITPLSLFVARFIASRTHKMFAEQSKTRGEQTAFIDEVINHQKIVTLYNRTDESIDKFNEINDRLEKCSLRAVFFSSLTNPSTRFVNNLVYAGVALTGALTVIGGTGLSVGNLSAFLSYANQYTKPFNEISGVITELQNSIACAARLFELIEEAPQVSDAGADMLGEADGDVKISDVSFSYVKDKKLIEGLSVDVKRGQRIAIVGPTGCGKTTLINLLMRFYDVDSGEITVDGKDVRSITRKSLRQNYGMVLQDTWLKSGTVRDNITVGKPNATDEEVIAAAKAAHAHSFIKRLPNGYDTVIGEDGGSLSQGQKQLLCITRIMLCLPPMLILDEATSSIDTRTEMKIQKAFEVLMQGRTSFIVAHRLSTIREADVILVMKDGNVIEKGSHEGLLSAGGFYCELYNSQFAG